MTRFFITIGSALVALILLFGAVYINTLQNGFVLSGATGGYAYNSTTTDTTNSTTGNTGRLLDTGSGVFRRVVITKTSNAPLYVYDATTTTNGAIYGTTTLAAFPSTTVGEYNFDAPYNTGLLIVTASTVGIASSSIQNE